MNSEKRALLESRNKCQIDIKMYKDFLNGKTQTFEGRYGAEEYIMMAENRLKDINQKLERMEKDKNLNSIIEKKLSLQ